MTTAMIDAPVDGVTLGTAAPPKNAVPSWRIGLVINPRSHANKADPDRMESVLARHPEIRSASPANAAELHAALREFAFAQVDLVVISGGDGTVRDVLSALAASDFASPPDLAILSAGNTNLAGRVLGSPGHGSHAFERLIDAITNGRTRKKTCPVLKVSWLGEPVRPPVHGFLFGAAAFTEAKRIAADTVQRRGIHEGLAVAVTLIATLVKALVGRTGPPSGGTLTEGARMEVSIDDAPASDTRRFLVLATTLDRLMLGLWPFWGRGRGGIRWLDIDAPAPWLGAAVCAVLLRRPGGWMTRRGYRSGRADTLRIRMDQPFILDGEAFVAGPDGIMLSVSRSVTVITA
jgi:hypothetical protein